MSSVDLLASCWTHAGDAAPLRGDELSPWSLNDRIDAVAAAGWAGIGLLHADLIREEREGDLAAVAQRIRDRGLRFVEVEFLGDWWKDGEARAASDAMRADLLRHAEVLGARTIKVSGEMSRDAVDLDRMAEEFDRLSNDAAGVGARIALEALPFSNFATIEQGAAFVNGVANPAGGLIVDIWHVFRGGSTLEGIEAALDPRFLVAVELNDAPAHTPAYEDLWEDTIDGRLLPGEGDWDVPAFIRTMRRVGFDGPWGVEILGTGHRAKSLDEATRSAYEATMAQFAAAES
jgi:sugar phosphate isomerase/epimerase